MLSKLKAHFSPEPPAPLEPAQQNNSLRDMIVGGAFVGAIALLLVVAGYVISRISADNAYKKKWEDYQDCGWA